MGHVQDTPVSTKMILNECMIYHMKVHIVSYNLGQIFFFSKSRSFILPNYEQTDSKTAIVLIGIDVTVASTLQFDKNLNIKLENLLLIMNSSFFSIKYVILSFFLDWLTFETVILMIRNFSVVAGNDQRLKQST